MVVGPDGRPLGMARVPQQPPRTVTTKQQGVGSMVEQPAKVMRIGTMIKQLLEEVRAAPLDEASRQRLEEIHETPSRSSRKASRPSCARSCTGCRCRSPRTPSRQRRRAADRAGPAGRAGWRGCSTASRRRCSPSRWPRGRSWSRCAAASRRVPGAGPAVRRRAWAGARASTCSRVWSRISILDEHPADNQRAGGGHAGSHRPLTIAAVGGDSSCHQSSHCEYEHRPT